MERQELLQNIQLNLDELARELIADSEYECAKTAIDSNLVIEHLQDQLRQGGIEQHKMRAVISLTSTAGVQVVSKNPLPHDFSGAGEHGMADKPLEFSPLSLNRDPDSA